ncbi:MAG TPA: hypothetical protein VK184_09525 [Nostocaceae cyanobacterium]|nr:hypothetical protein [Nostocaceae cyanobacterium]
MKHITPAIINFLARLWGCSKQLQTKKGGYCWLRIRAIALL